MLHIGNIDTITIFALMAMDKTYTYQQAKHVFNNAVLKDKIILDIEQDNFKIFRKHLSEMIKRKESTKRFSSRLLNNNQIKVYRIE